jgi:hypothetical protein
MYSKFTKDFGVIICFYVDDMLIFNTNMIGIVETKRYFTSIFKMKGLGEVDTILGIKVKKHSSGYALNQSHYIEKMLNKFKHLNKKEANTPFDFSMKLNDYCDKTVAQLEYASAIGSFMYVMHCTKPDIAFGICKLTRYTSKPNTYHWKAIARVFGYLKRMIDLGLFYFNFPDVMEGHSDANWMTSSSDNKYTSGWILSLVGGAISWASKKQTYISHSIEIRIY